MLFVVCLIIVFYLFDCYFVANLLLPGQQLTLSRCKNNEKTLFGQIFCPFFVFALHYFLENLQKHIFCIRSINFTGAIYGATLGATYGATSVKTLHPA